MKKQLMTGLFTVLALTAGAQTFQEWRNPEINAVNRAPMHTNYFAFENADAAKKANKKQSTNYMTLNGTWKFNWVKDADSRPTDFWKTGFNDKGWDDLQVPAVWELNGYGDPIYVNVGYAWRNQFQNNPPEVPTENNHVGSYRREIVVPASWNGKDIIAHFGSVTSNMYLWVNGRYVGYSEDSKLEAEFDLTPYLKPGQKNLIAFQVFRWCDGSYLEDQDFFRYSGVGRDCYLYARNKKRIQDIRVTPDLDAAYQNGSLAINLDLKGSGKVDLELVDAQGKQVATATANKSGLVTMNVENPKKWSAETPYLYTLRASMQGSNEVIPVKVGFRKIELKGDQILVNGKAVLFKGADRHEMDPDGGYVVSPERMLQDIQIMKQFNLNAVRTCHYPDDNLWYDLCDQYGIYVVAEANIESHGMGYGEKTLAKNPSYKKAHLERNQRNVQRGFNHPSIIFWSLGNEAGDGPNFEQCYQWIKAEDPSRACQYEQARQKDHTDIFCPMYYGYRENNFSLDFSILNYINPELNRYLYRLEGYDKEWLSVEAGRRFAYYNNLPAGTYTFCVKGANQNGIWSPDMKCLRITILPPPWLSWWAYCLYVLLFVSLAWYTYRIVRNRIRMKQAIEMGKIERQKMEEINHAKLQFFTNITHELLTPLSIISASVDELKQEVPASSSVCPVIADNTVRLIRLIQQILEFRKVENGKLRLKVSHGNVSMFLKKSVSAFAPLVKKQKLSIQFDLSEEYSGYFDVDKLDKVVYNLLSNAAKYTPEGGTIVVSQAHDEERGTFKLSVNNPGELIPKEKLDHMFERFYEGEYRKFHTIGTGIGLSLTKDLVLLHHGTIQVFSDKEEGNTFVVEIPIRREAFDEDEVDENTENVDYAILSADEMENVSEIDMLEEKPAASTILLVEDNEELLALMVRLLHGKYHILKAANGTEALEILAKQEVDLIVSDVMMPEMDGMELCRRVKTQFETCHIPLILLTAKTSDEDRVEGYESGADGYICKPLRLSVLFAKIDNLLKRRKRMGVDFRKQLVFEAKELNYTSMDEAFIRKAVDCVNAHLSDCDFEHAQFMAEMGMARTTLADKLKLLTGLTPSAFISNVRLQAACRLIDEKKKIRIADLAYAVGFNDPKYFSSCFKKKFGLSPTEYMMKYDG